jgi:hypothetical protein
MKTSPVVVDEESLDLIPTISLGRHGDFLRSPEFRNVLLDRLPLERHSGYSEMVFLACG